MDSLDKIDEIAEQTNLLALNAAIEAARESAAGVTEVSGSADELDALTERLRQGVQRFDLGTQKGDLSSSAGVAAEPSGRVQQEGPDVSAPESLGDRHLAGHPAA